MTETVENARDDRCVGFVLAGVQKGGTSSLFEMLAAHPQIAESSPKELHYFDREGRSWDKPNYRRYLTKFNWQPASVLGAESTPSYVFWPGAMKRIHAYNPEMRIALSFRDPIERAFSEWRMAKQRDSTVVDFNEATRAARTTHWPRTVDELNGHKFTFVSRGYYGAQLEAVRELFPAEQVLPLDFGVVFRDLHAGLDRITDFLGLDRFATYPAESARRQKTQRLRASAPSAADVAMLAGLYADDLARFAELSGIDVSTWPTMRLVSGELGAEEFAAKLAERAGIPATRQAIKKQARRDEAKEARRAARTAPSEGGEGSDQAGVEQLDAATELAAEVADSIDGAEESMADFSARV